MHLFINKLQDSTSFIFVQKVHLLNNYSTIIKKNRTKTRLIMYKIRRMYKIIKELFCLLLGKSYFCTRLS